MNDQEQPVSDQAEVQPEQQAPVYQVITAIKDGELDDRLVEIIEAIRARQEDRKEEVLALVHEVFGSNATIAVPKSETPQKMNPFEKKAKAIVAQPEPEKLDENDGVEQDGLSHLDDVERKMIEEEGQDSEVRVDVQPTQPAGDYVPPEQRGATISGLHSSQIAG